MMVNVSIQKSNSLQHVLRKVEEYLSTIAPQTLSLNFVFKFQEICFGERVQRNWNRWACAWNDSTFIRLSFYLIFFRLMIHVQLVCVQTFLMRCRRWKYVKTRRRNILNGEICFLFAWLTSPMSLNLMHDWVLTMTLL
jgi:hypothetical protein